MKKALIMLLFMFLLLPTPEVFAQKVLVNIWDGVEWANVKSLYGAGNLPNAQSVGPLYHLTDNEECFFEGGPQCFHKSKTCHCMKTMTMTQVTVMLTGVLADVSGVFNGRTHGMIPAGLTVYEKLMSFNPDIMTAHITGKPDQDGLSTFGNVSHVVDFFRAEDVVQEVNADDTITLINQWSNRDFFIVVHFREPDHTGHRDGVNSEQYRNAILENDRQLGRMIQALSGQGILDETNIYVIADHGFGCPRETAHGCSPNTFIISKDTNMTDTIMVDVADYFLSDFGLQRDPFDGGVIVTSPNGGENWSAGTMQTIKWSYTGNPGPSVTIELYKGGTFAQTIASGVSMGSNGIGSYDWPVPTILTGGTDYTIKITSNANNLYWDQSDSSFTITIPPKITITAPNGGESWQSGTTQTITWTYTGDPGSSVMILLLKGGMKVATITLITPIGGGGSGAYKWNIPSTQATGSDYKIKIVSTTNSTIKSFSKTFTIRP